MQALVPPLRVLDQLPKRSDFFGTDNRATPVGDAALVQPRAPHVELSLQSTVSLRDRTRKHCSPRWYCLTLMHRLTLCSSRSTDLSTNLSFCRTTMNCPETIPFAPATLFALAPVHAESMDWFPPHHSPSGNHPTGWLALSTSPRHLTHG